ncbi:MAG: 3-deoxy-manno-octulosonate cytidylyltransferase [Bacteroidales bacterium]|nr:3-deoxy-manno-octulosonate cytidylyltransferase [Bacteroidales bacterium]
MKFLCIIPARYASTRFPGKPLADIGGKTMIQRVYQQALKALDNVVVATDDQRISDVIRSFNGNVVMTSELHKSGTDRCAEALQIIETQKGESYDVVLNIQGDEPFIQPEQLKSLMLCFNDPFTEIATLIKPVTDNTVLFDPNKPKVVLNSKDEAIYFSRSVIPHIRSVNSEEWIKFFTFYMHIGIYAYRKNILQEITKLEPSILEKAESLEQLRWLENGYKIKTALTEHNSYGIDTPDDLKNLKKMGLF